MSTRKHFEAWDDDREHLGDIVVGAALRAFHARVDILRVPKRVHQLGMLLVPAIDNFLNEGVVLQRCTYQLM